MPSPFRFRERFTSRSSSKTHLAAESSSRSTSGSTSPVPPSTESPLPTISIQPPPPPPPPTAPTENYAFISALKIHTQSLSPEEQKAFSDSSAITPEALIAQIRNYDKSHNQESHSRRCASQVQGFLTALEGYLKPVSIMVGHSPEISSLVVGGVKLIVQLGLRFSAFFNKLTEMMEHLAGHLGYLAQYAESFKHSREVQEALSSAYRDLLKFCTGARNVFVDKEGNPSRWVSFRVFLRVTWEPFEESFDALNSEFRNHVDIVIRTATIVEHERLRSKEVLEAEEKEDRSRRDLLRWLSKLEFDKDHDRIFSKRHPDTGNWLVESPEFEGWVETAASSLLWCHGSPGVGKSVLASLVLETISTKYALDNRIGIAFIYFSFQEQADQKPIWILSTMIKQLARRKKVLPNQLKQFYQKYYRDADFPSEEKLQAQFLDLSKTFDQVFLVMDGMDEFEDRKGFLSIITKFAQDSSIKFKIFVTSRKEKDIENAFTKHDFPTIQIEAKKVDADIAVFVRHQMEKQAEESGVLIDKALKGKIEHVLTSKSSGMFLWVRYQLDYIYEQPSIKDIKAALNSLPYDMNATYLRILAKIDKQVPARRKLARRALMWVACAARPLELKELAIAVSMEPEYKSHRELEVYGEQIILSTCGNLLTVENGIVRPVHYSVQEFLTAPQWDSMDIEGSALLQKYQIITDYHIDLAQICLQYLLLEEFETSRFSHGYYHGHYKFALGRYAAKYWDYHAQMLPTLPDSLANLIDQLLDSDGTNLVCAYIMRGKTARAPVGQMNPLIFCLSYGLLHFFQRSHRLDASIRDSEKYREALHFAARGGSVSSIKALIEMGFSVEVEDRDGELPFYYAALRGHEEAFLLLLNNYDLNDPNEYYRRALKATTLGDYKTVMQVLLDKATDFNHETLNNAFYAAAHGGHEKMVQVLLDRGADINTQVGWAGSALVAAVQGGHGSMVKMLLEKGADVNIQGGNYNNALYMAASSGYETIVQTLLDNGADISTQGIGDNNALYAAADRGHRAIVQMLLDRGVDVNTQGGVYSNALQAAASRGDIIMAEMLLERGADVNAQNGYYGNVLQAAAYQGNDTLMKILLDKGADVNAQGGEYGNALHAAALRGHETIVKMLLDLGADANTDGGEYGSTLQSAASGGHETVVRMLLEKGPDVNAQSVRYGNALYAAALGGYENVVQILLDKGADVNMEGANYSTALQAAAYNGQETVVQLLLGKGADVNALGGNHGSALHAAACRGFETIVKILLDKGADVNIQPEDSDNVLYTAAYGGNETVVQMFLDEGMDVNTQGGHYGNPLQAAVVGGFEKVVQVLLENGADFNIQGGYYNTALQAAADRGYDTIVQLLLDKGANVNAQGGVYGNALQAATSSGHKKVMRMLLNKGADVNIQGGEYGNTLQAAALLGRESVVQMLLDNGADINAQGGRYGNALQAAALRGNEEVLRLLYNNGADINAQGGEFDNALYAAAYGGYGVVLRTLLDKGIDINVQGKNYRNILQAAARGGHETIVQMLLDKGLDANAPAGKYGTALEAATEFRYDNIVQMLLQAGARRGGEEEDK